MKTALSFVVLLLLVSPLVHAADQPSDNWIDISSANLAKLGSQGGIGGCAGCAVNRLNGDVMVNFIGFGLWKSSDRGQSWARLDGGAISGRGESGWAVQVDQDNPKRVAVFSLDGDAGYTTDGAHWTKFKGMGRNWDFGSVDWGSPDAKVILAGKHESGGEVYGSDDGGQSWTKLSINMDPQRNRNSCMIGVIDARTFIYSNNNGIQRSTDQGATWQKVSDFQPRSKIPVLFKKKFYLCTSQGIIVSKDKGATWQLQGSEIDLAQGPDFGANENTMVATGPKGVFKTVDSGKTWTEVAALRGRVDGKEPFDVGWFGTYTWDPFNNVVYATRMTCPAIKVELGPPARHTSSDVPAPKPVHIKQDARQIAVAEKAINDLYKLQLASAKTPDQKTALANKILESGTTETDSAARFVLARKGAELAASAGNTAATFAGMDEVESACTDPLPVWTECLEILLAHNPDDLVPPAEKIDALFSDALAKEDFIAAAKLASMAAAIARFATDPAQMTIARNKASEVSAAKDESRKFALAQEQLKKDPADAAAKAVTGRYLCLVRRDSEHGLPMLNESNDKVLQPMAVAELAANKTPTDLAALGDSWMAAAKKVPFHLAAQDRGLYWYRQALPLSTGLTQIRIEKELAGHELKFGIGRRQKRRESN